MLWAALRKRRLGGLRFRRRHAIGPFLLDFCCLEAGLAVALDAETRGARDAALVAAGVTVLRFAPRLVERHLAGVVAGIRAAARRRPSAPVSAASSGAGPGR
jgi:very-short-patch-repair endonuclease